MPRRPKHPQPPLPAAFRESFGNELKRARDRLGITQGTAAAIAQIDEKNWQRLEQGSARMNPTLKTLFRIAQALETDIASLTRTLR